MRINIIHPPYAVLDSCITPKHGVCIVAVNVAEERGVLCPTPTPILNIAAWDSSAAKYFREPALLSPDDEFSRPAELTSFTISHSVSLKFL